MCVAKARLQPAGQGLVGEQRLRIGQPGFACGLSQCPIPDMPDEPGQWLLLGDTQGVLAWLRTHVYGGQRLAIMVLGTNWPKISHRAPVTTPSPTADDAAMIITVRQRRRTAKARPMAA